MVIQTPGHKYLLPNFEKREEYQQIQFIEKQQMGPDLVTVNDGTTNEEVLTMLIDRLKFLNEKLASRETSVAIRKCEEALMWLNARTKERQARGVEGTHKA
jgi:hypothetical protein